MDQNQKFEHKVTHDLQTGHSIDAAVALQDEFHKNPQEALKYVQERMNREQNCASTDKSTLGIDAKSGDVFVYDKNHDGYYAGTVPDAGKDQTCPGPQTDAAAQAAPQEAPPQGAATPVEAAPVQAAPVDAPPPGAYAPDGGPQPYEYDQPRHRGFHIPFPIQIGVHNGSLQLGVNVLGLAKGGVTLGRETRGYVGSDVAHTEVSAGVDFKKSHIGPAADWNVIDGNITQGSARVGFDPRRDGVDIGGGVNASAFHGAIGAGGRAVTEVGQHFGPNADGYAYVGPAEASAGGYAKLSDQGLQTGGDADVGAQPAVGVHGKVRAGLGARNEAHADVGANVGDNGGSVGAGIYPQFHPDVYAKGYSGDDSAGVGLIPARAWTRHDQSDADDRY